MQIIEVTGFGVRSAVLRLRRKGSPMQFVVYPMIHIGTSEFYEEVSTRLRHAQMVVVEGVKDGARPSVLASALTLSYRVARFNRRVNLAVQDIDYEALGVPVVNPDVTVDEFRTSWRRIPIATRLLVWCVLPVVTLGRLIGAGSAMWTKATEVNDLPSDEDERLAESAPELTHAMLDERDERLLDCLSRLHEERGEEKIEVAVVYGAGHVPAIVHGLQQRFGYVARVGEWLTVVDLLGEPEQGRPDKQRPDTDKGTDKDGPDRADRPARATIPRQPRTGLATTRPKPPEKVQARPSEVESVAPAGSGLERAQADVDRARPQAASGKYTDQSDLAEKILTLSDRLADDGQLDEAMRAADEAVDLAEDLCERYGTWYRQLHARATYTLAQRLQILGRVDDATTVHGESVEILRATYPNDPYRRATVLAPALVNYTQQLMVANRFGEAVAAAQEAVDLCRAARKEAPDELTTELTFALRNLTLGLRGLNRNEEAVRAGKRAVNVARRLAQERPQMASLLTETLGELANAQRAAGAHDEAVETAREAVDAARTLVAGSRPGERRHLALRLGVLSNVLKPEDSAEAVEAAAEAVELWRAVAAARPVDRRDLALSLSWLAELQRRYRVEDLGAACADEAEAIARDIAAGYPDRGRRVLAKVLPRVARVLDAVGEPERARAITEEIEASS